MDLELPPQARPAVAERPKEPPPQAVSNPLPFDIFGPAPTPVPTQARNDPGQLVFGAPQVVMFPGSVPPPAPDARPQPTFLPQPVQPPSFSYPQPPQPTFNPPPPAYTAPPSQPTVSYPQPSYPSQPAPYAPAGYQPNPSPYVPAPTGYNVAPAPAQPAYPGPPQVRIKHNMSAAEEAKKPQDSKPKDLFDDLVQL